MKKTNRNRMAAPVSASFALLLALSACSSSGVNQGGGTNNSGSSESASAPTEDGRQIVGLGDDNKAGKPRPRSERETRGNQNQVKSDGSWTEKTLSGQEKITVNADGTWVNKTGEKEFTLHADGSWEEKETKSGGEEAVTHVNPDGTWRTTEGSKKEELHADGTWRSESSGGFVTYSDVNGKVYMEGSSGKPFEITNETYTTVRTPSVPSPRVGYGLGIGGGGVLPLTPRKPLYPGQQAVS